MNLLDYGLSNFDDPGFDLLSQTEAQAWYRRQWTSIATALDFAQDLAMRYQVTSPVAPGAHNEAGLAAFTSKLARTRPSTTQADVQMRVLETMISRGRGRGELWRVVEDPTTLPDGACFADGTTMHRAFFPDTAPGYFGDGWSGPPPRASSACGWQTPLALHLGTFPWVYNASLEGPGVAWGVRPASTALSVVAAMLEPEMNLRQDAQQVAAVCRAFSAHTSALIRNLPVMSPAGTWTATRTRLRVGDTYVRGNVIHVHQGSVHVAGLTGARGRISVHAYNYCVGRFSAFFSLRAAIIRALPRLSPTLQQLALGATDPVLRAHAQSTMRG